MWRYEWFTFALTAFVKQFADGDEAIASDPLIPVALWPLRRIVVHLGVNTVVVVVVAVVNGGLPGQVGRQDVLGRQPVKVLEVDAEDKADDDGDDEKNSPVHEGRRRTRRRRLANVRRISAGSRTTTLFSRHALTQILSCACNIHNLNAWTMN